MLWSQKFLTLSINISSISWQNIFFTILTGFPEIWPRPTRHLDFLGSKIAKSTFFQFFQYKSLWFCFKSELWLFSAFFWGVKRFCSSKIADFRIFDRFFYVWTLATSATSGGRNFSLSNLNRVPNFSKICQLSYEILLVGLEWKWGGVRGCFPKWVDSTPPKGYLSDQKARYF